MEMLWLKNQMEGQKQGSETARNDLIGRDR